MTNNQPLKTLSQPPQDWSAEQRLLALQKSYGLSGEALDTWCREHSLFTHQLTQWRQDFCQPIPNIAIAEGNIEKLFSNGSTVAALPITEYLNWAANPNKYSRILSLPPIQRGFVWKPKQIQDLWDSLLRDMPIGSVLLKVPQNDICRPMTAETKPVEKKNNSEQGFHLMDGQQRTLSMLLGFPSFIEEKEQHKLWIDFSSAGRNGSEFQFRITTVNQPFGYNTDGGRLSLQERREARINWNGKEPSEEIKNKTNKDIFEDGSTRPWKSGGKKTEYIFEVKHLWQWLYEQPTISS